MSSTETLVTPALVRKALADKIKAEIPDLKNAWNYEPEQLGELPATTLLLAYIQPEEKSTGPRLDVTWNFQLRVYVGLSDWEGAQAQLEDVCFRVLGCWRDDPTLGDLLDFWRIADTGEPPVFSAPDRWLRKSMLIQAQIEHVPLPYALR